MTRKQHFARLCDADRLTATRAARGLALRCAAHQDGMADRAPAHSRARLAWLAAGMSAEDLARLVAIAETIAPYAAGLET